MNIGILGPLEVRGAKGSVELPRGRARALFALLAIRPDTVISADRLIDELWGESPPPTASTKLHGLVSSLRKRIDSNLIETHPGGYRLAVDPLVVDAQRFRRLVEQAGGSSVAEKRELLALALGLWRGSALEDFTYEPFAQTEIMVLGELRIKATEERIEADLALGRHGELIPELQRLLSSHPLREHLTAQLMIALYRDGRQAEALRLYQDLGHRLKEELGIYPGPDLQRLEELILNQDPLLEKTEYSTEAGLSAWLPERRKPATVMFVGLANSEVVDDVELSRLAIQRAFRLVSDTIGGHGGTVQGFLGDVVVAVFGIPIAHEDDALRAVRAAVFLRDALSGDEGIVFRIGINTGEVVVGDPSAQPSGTTVSVASRLHQTAGAGAILIGEATRRLLGVGAETAPAEAIDAPGARPRAWRLIGLVEVRVGPSPMVGRHQDLAILQKLFHRVVTSGSALQVEVIGEAGIGKSRLARELTSAIGEEALVLAGRCPAYGEGITFWPLRELLLQAIGEGGGDSLMDLGNLLGLTEAALIQVGGAVGLNEYPGDPLKLFGAVRDFFSRLARRRPLVLVIEDLHWGLPTFVGLLDYLAGTSDAPILIVSLARTEFAAMRPTDGRMERLLLGPLSPEDTERLMTASAGGWTLAADMMARVVETVQGNPLFAEQTMAALKEQDELTIPPSVHALLAARLDRLGPGEQDLARSAAVIGTDFSVEAVSALVPHAVRPLVGRHLDRLRAKGLLIDIQRTYLGDPGMAFGHVLIQAAAYRSVTRRDRADLHERVADWMEAKNLGGLEELVGYHLERAGADRSDLGINDEHTVALRQRAGEHLAVAGLSAYRKFDLTAAENLLLRAKTLLPADHRQRYEVLRRLAETYPMMGRLADADVVFEELQEEVMDEDLARGIRLERIRNQMIRGPDPLTLAQVRREAGDSLAAYRATGDETGMSQACYVLAFAHQLAGRVIELERIAWEGLAHARRSDPREEVGILWYLSAAMVLGPTPIEQAIGVCEQVAAAHGHTHGGILANLGVLYAMIGNFEKAREMSDTAYEDIFERRGVRRALSHVGLRAGQTEILAGDLATAGEKLRAALDLAIEIGESDLSAQLASTLAQVAADSGDLTEAASFAQFGRDRAPAESVIAQALWRAASARVLAKENDASAAERLILDALELVPDDLVNLRADLYRDLARAVPRRTEATASAGALYERKGNLVGLAELSSTRGGRGLSEDANGPRPLTGGHSSEGLRKNLSARPNPRMRM